MRVVLFPFGGNAREAVATIEALNVAGSQIEICGFLDDNHAQIRRSSLPMLGGARLGRKNGGVGRSCWLHRAVRRITFRGQP